MKMVALEVPDEPEQLVEWWERQLVGLDLVDLVAQLRLEENESANGEIANPTEVAAVLEGGLRALAPERLGRLAASPNQLLDWQDRVVDEGGIYWGSVVRSREHEAMHARVRNEVLATIESVNPERVSSVPATKGGRRVQWFALAVAASLLMALGIWWTRPDPAPTWGFDRPGVLGSEESAGELYLQLASAAGEWGRKVPTNADQLERRLEEFRHGCDTLLAAPLPQLVPAERAWLRDRCTEWRSELDERLAELESGESVDVVRQRADELAARIAEELTARAEGV